MSDEKKKSNAEFLKWFKPLIEALKELGDSSTPEQVRNKIAEDLNLSEEVINETYGKTNANKFANQVAFARNYLVYGGYIDKSKPGIWSLTESGKTVEMTEDLASDIFITHAPKHVKKEEDSSFEERLEELLAFYKKSFVQHWADEKYKWEAVKWFKDNWNEKEDFAEMFKKATKKAGNLLGSAGSYPLAQIFDFSKEDIKTTKEMFDNLYNESLKLEDRITNFKAKSMLILDNHNQKNPDSIWKSSFQNENSISTYLWLRYPDKYYIYKFSEVLKVERLLVDNPVIKKGEGIQNLVAGIELYNKLAEALKDDVEISKIFKDSLTDTCYEDPEFRTLAIDFGFHISRYYQDAVDESESNEEDNSVHYWIYSPGEKAKYWDQFYKEGIMAVGKGNIGDIKQFSSLKEVRERMKTVIDTTKSYINDGYCAWQFANELKPNDVVFVKQGMFKIIGRGVVTSEYIYDEKQKDGYNHIRKVNWTHNGDWEHPGQAVMKTLTDITVYTDYVNKLNALLNVTEEEQEETVVFNKPYLKSDFLKEVFISESKYDTLVNLLERKRNIILQGAPGVGKTFAAKRLAYSILGEIDKDKVKMVQFHQSYSYEDFIMGYRPNETGFEKKAGVFYEFCKKAEMDKENKYFFIIDEINRGNMSKIFGELLMLIEKDKRGQQLQLLYSNEQFSIPANLYIIGMMNTADRSLAIIDYALRRRFAFIEFEPAFESGSEGFEALKNSIENPKYAKLIGKIAELNRYISADQSLGKGFRIGHSYFVPENGAEVDDTWLNDIVDYEVIPLLEEYWFDNTDELNHWSNVLKDSLK